MVRWKNGRRMRRLRWSRKQSIPAEIPMQEDNPAAGLGTYMLKNRGLIMCFIIVLMTPVWAWSHQDVWLRNEQGDRITPILSSVDPYSPKKTCGACHPYSIITSGYHFQQGFDVIKDGYDAAKPWILSPGMFGAWLPTAAAGRLAAKNNTNARQMDLSTYDWIGAGKYSAKHKVKSSSCGSCHPGGGPMEYGRNSKGRADLGKTLIAGEAANQGQLDGDYSSRFTADSKSHFRASGVVEADCLICHRSAYRMKERSDQLYRRNYRWAATAGAGLGVVKGAVFTYSNPVAGPDHPDFTKGSWNLSKRPVVSYNWLDRNLFGPDGRMKGSLIKKSVSSKSCLQCHAEGEAKNTGTSFSPADDVHVKAGMACTDCHPLVGKAKTQRLAHQIAKGKSLTGHVRDDLDGVGMRTCIQLSFRRTIFVDPAGCNQTCQESAGDAREAPFRCCISHLSDFVPKLPRHGTAAWRDDASGYEHGAGNRIHGRPIRRRFLARGLSQGCAQTLASLADAREEISAGRAQTHAVVRRKNEERRDSPHPAFLCGEGGAHGFQSDNDQR